jgi:hypothetical protein
MSVSETGLLRFSRRVHALSEEVVKPYTSIFSRKDYTQPQLLAINCIKIRKRQRFREAEDDLKNMPPVCEALGLQKVPITRP